jgi:alkanesulfonate monooxygenase SsuD/methylene tetrahydromethanopterin reductase-like flavin-dependent oxidoreductase (luciferase family)
LHDTVAFEIAGVPAVSIASSEFRDAAASQARALGMDARCCFVRHPIQDRTDAEMSELADEVYAEVVAALTTAA